MLIKTLLIFFLAYAFVLVSGRNLTPNNEYSQQELEEIRYERGLGDIVQSLADAAINTIKQETNSISDTLHSFKDTVGKFANAGKKVIESGWVAATAAPQIGINLLSGNSENGDISSAIKGPLSHMKETIHGAVESIKDASSNAITSGFMAAKTTWDLSTFLPKFGINLVKDKEFYKKLEEALKKTYEEEKLSVNQAIGSVKSAGQKLKSVSAEVTQTTLELAKSVTKLAIEAVNNPENDDENMKKFDEIRKKVQSSFELIKEAAAHIKTAGNDVTKAGVDLSIVVPKYGLNLLSEEDKKNIEKVIKEEIEDIKKSIKKAVIEVNEAAKKIREATTQSTKAGIDIGFILPQLGYNILKQDEKDVAEAIRKTLGQTQKSIQIALEKIQNAGEKIVTAGEDVATAGWKLGTSVPRIGISILSEQKDKIDENQIQSLEEQKEQFLDLLNQIQSNGEELQKLGIGVSQNNQSDK